MYFMSARVAGIYASERVCLFCTQKKSNPEARFPRARPHALLSTTHLVNIVDVVAFLKQNA